MNEKMAWEAEKRNMERIFAGISGLPIKVKDTEDNSIGYTSEDGAICLSYHNSLTDKVTSKEASAIRIGVGFHELLHKMKTNFKICQRTIKSLPKFEGYIFHEIDNILEDAAIEEYADEVAGGYVLDSLRFAIAKTYELSLPLEESENAFSQFISALIMFGDMGVLKGHFTFPEAKRIFKETAPIFYKGLRSKNTLFRNQCSKEIFQLSEPLWKPYVEDLKKQEEMLQALKKMLEEMGVMENNGSGTGEGKGSGTEKGEDGKEGANESKKNNRRKLTIKKISQEELEEMTKDEKSSGEKSSGSEKVNTIILGNKETDEKQEGKEKSKIELADDVTVYVVDDKKEKEEGKKDDSSSIPVKEDDEKKQNEENGSDDNPDSSKNENESDSSKEDESSKYNPIDRTKSSNNSLKYGKKENKREDDDGENQIDKEELELSEDVLEKIHDDIENSLEKINEEIESTENHGDIDFNIKAPKVKGAKCMNYMIKPPTRKEDYNKIVSALKPGIRSLVNQMRIIFQNDVEERIYKNNGRINTKRLYGGRITSRVFDKIREPENKSDFSVFLLIDESGSMSGAKASSARSCAIALAEVFEALNIPIYVMGFTADINGYDAIHNHYIQWGKTKTQKYSLINIAGRSDNFDGYSIRYAGEIIKKKNSLHKLLIVISDGQPACYFYKGEEGIADTKNAIQEVSKYTDVLGVLIGNSDVEEVHYMYGNNFMNIKKVDDLFMSLSKKIAKIVLNEM